MVIIAELKDDKGQVVGVVSSSPKSFGCVPFELKIRLQSGKVSFTKNTPGRSHDLQLRIHYTRRSCSI